jgi:hypothetical protein
VSPGTKDNCNKNLSITGLKFFIGLSTPVHNLGPPKLLLEIECMCLSCRVFDVPRCCGGDCYAVFACFVCVIFAC